jgi:hypothetical protein
MNLDRSRAFYDKLSGKDLTMDIPPVIVKKSDDGHSTRHLHSLIAIIFISVPLLILLQSPYALQQKVTAKANPTETLLVPMVVTKEESTETAPTIDPKVDSIEMAPTLVPKEESSETAPTIVPKVD